MTVIPAFASLFALSQTVPGPPPAAPPFSREAPAAASQAADEDDVPAIVILGTRLARADRALSADPVTDIMSQSSRAIERDVLTAIGTYRLSDALELVSGVSAQNNRGGFLDNFAVRGFLGTPDGGAEYYVDGFLANRGMAPPRDPATAERIELLKGPAGALFGDIDPGGRVNIVSKTPGFVPAASAIFTYGSFDTRRIELDGNLPLTDTLALRLVVADEHSDGWRRFVSLDRRVIAPSLTWQPFAGVRLTYIGEVMRFDAPFDRGVPAIGGDANAAPRRNFYGEPADGITRFRNERHQLTGVGTLGGGWSVNGGIAWRTGSLRGFSSDQSRLVGDRTLWRQRRSRDFTVDDLSARIELAGRIGDHRVSIGAKGYLLDYGERWMRRNPTAAMPYPIDVFDPVYGGPQPDLLPFTNNDETRRAGTLYVQDMWQASERLTLTGGIRLDAYRQAIRNNRTGLTGVTADEPVNFRVGARYRLTGAIALHANWGESFVLNSGTDRFGTGFAPERGNGYELGIAGAWTGIDVAVTLFDIRKRGILTNDPVDANFLAPIGNLRSRGVELDASVRLAGGWQLVGNYAFTHARTDDAAFATDRVLNVPRHSGSLFAIGRFQGPDGRGLSVSGGIAHVGDRAGAIDTSGLILPAYWKAKAAADYALTPHVAVRLEADNLFDAGYAQSSYSPVWIFPGAPRTIRASLRISL